MRQSARASAIRSFSLVADRAVRSLAPAPGSPKIPANFQVSRATSVWVSLAGQSVVELDARVGDPGACQPLARDKPSACRRLQGWTHSRPVAAGRFRRRIAGEAGRAGKVDGGVYVSRATPASVRSDRAGSRRRQAVSPGLQGGVQDCARVFATGPRRCPEVAVGPILPPSMPLVGRTPSIGVPFHLRY